MLSSRRREIERVIKRYLIAWQREDWGGMYRSAQLTWASKTDSSVAALEAMVGDTPLISYEIDHVGNPQGNLADVDLRLEIGAGEAIRRYTAQARLVQESAPYSPNRNGKWGVNPLSILRMHPVEDDVN